MTAVEDVVAEGVPPSSREVRDLLLPRIDDLPDGAELPPGFRLVLREIDRYLATRTPRPVAATAPEPSPEVAEAARLLGGKSVLLIGGLRRPGAQQALRKALALGELIWIETKEHESIDRFGPYVARPEVALVLLAIRWSSHSFGDVKRSCDEHGKPMVRLPGVIIRARSPPRSSPSAAGNWRAEPESPRRRPRVEPKRIRR